MTAQARQTFKVVDEGQVGGGVKLGIVWRGSLIGADLAQALLIHRLGDGLEFTLGDSEFRRNLAL